MTRAKKVSRWVGAIALLAVVALFTSSCGSDEVAGAEKTHIEGPSRGLHRPSESRFGGCGECPCERDGKGFCGVCHLFEACVYCDTAAFCPADPCDTECPTSDHGSGSSKCPSGFPHDCENGTCCPSDHPQCCGGGRCATLDETCD